MFGCLECVFCSRCHFICILIQPSCFEFFITFLVFLDEEVHISITVLICLVRSKNLNSFPLCKCSGLSDTLAMWKCVVLLLQSEELIVRNAAAEVIRVAQSQETICKKRGTIFSVTIDNCKLTHISYSHLTVEYE